MVTAFGLVTVGIACGGGEGAIPAPPAAAEDAAADDASSAEAGLDAGEAGDAAPAPEDGGAGTLPRTCEGPCRAMAVTIRVEGRTGKVSRAQFGVTSAAKSGTGRPELHVELHEGGDPACPTESSPTPERTVVVSGLPVADVAATYGMPEGVRLTLLDFGRALTEEPLLRATEIAITPVAQSIDVASGGEGDGGGPADFVAFEVRATLPGGELVGRVFAERCASLDLR